MFAGLRTLWGAEAGEEAPERGGRLGLGARLGWLGVMLGAWVLLAIAATWPVVTSPSTLVLGDGELGGWLWRYWLMKLQIAAIQEELPGDPVRAFFTIISLGRFPETGNVLDLLALSLPLERLFGHPAYYNAKCFVLILTNCLSAYTLFYHLSRRRLVAFVAATTFGFNSFVFYEIFTSGLRQALMCFLPLFALALEKMLVERRARHAAAAGIFLALTAIFYWFNGLFAGIYAGLRVLWHVGERWGRVQWLQLLGLLILVGVFTAPIAGVFMWPYLGEAYKDPGAPGLPEVQWFTDFPSLKALANVPTVPTNPEENLLASLSRVIPSSWSLDWVFNPLHQRAMPLVFGLGAVGVGLFRWRSVGFWLLTFFFFYLMTGGPYLRLFDEPGQMGFFFLADHYAVRLPYAWAFKFVPLMSRLFAPYRMGCLVMLAMGALLALNLSALGRRLRGRQEVAAAGAFLLLYFGQFFGDPWIVRMSDLEGYGKDRGLPVFSSEIETHPFYDRLAEEPPMTGIIHLPVMYQQDLTTYYQTIHAKKVFLQTGWANPGALPPILRYARDPEGPTTPVLQYLLKGDNIANNSFASALLALNNPPHSFQPYRAEDVSALYDQGYRYILLHERGCYLVRTDSGTALYDALRQKLIRRFGQPVVEVKEFQADPTVGNKPGHVVAGVQLGWVSSEPMLIPSKRPLSYHLAVFRVDGHVAGLPGATLDPPPGAAPAAPTPAPPVEAGDAPPPAEAPVAGPEAPVAGPAPPPAAAGPEAPAATPAPVLGPAAP